MSEYIKSSQSPVKWAFASLLFALWYYFGTTKKAATTAKKAPAKAAKVENNIYVQFSGMEFDTAAIEKAVKADYTAKNGKKDMKSVSIYIKPEDMKAYYVIDGIIGDVAL